MGRDILTFVNIEIVENKFYHYKSPIFFQKMWILKMYQCLRRFLLVKKQNKCFTCYLHNDYKIKPLHIMLPKTGACRKNYDGQTKWMYFLIEDDDLQKKYNTI